MRRMVVRDVMTTAVFAVGEGTPVDDVAEVMDDRGVSALPVAGDGRKVLGVVSRTDLLPGFSGSSAGRPAGVSWRRAASGQVAADVMNAPAITIVAEATVVEAARRLIHHGLKRLPVVDPFGRLVGVVSRADLVRAFARTDEELRAEIECEVFERALCLAPGAAEAGVTDGVVVLTGEVERKSLIPITVSLTRQIAGVVDVVDRLTFLFDDMRADGRS